MNSLELIDEVNRRATSQMVQFLVDTAKKKWIMMDDDEFHPISKYPFRVEYRGDAAIEKSLQLTKSGASMLGWTRRVDPVTFEALLVYEPASLVALEDLIRKPN